MDDRQYPLYWVGSTKKDLKGMPSDVQDSFGFALHLAQQGKKHFLAKPLKGFAGTSVLEVVADHAGNTFRAIYTTALGNAIYVLHCFQKKSVHGIKTPKRDIDLIKQRMKMATRHAEENQHEKH